MVHLRPLVRVRSVKPLDRFRVHLQFDDGTQREADLATYLRGPIFEPIRSDPALFRSDAMLKGGPWHGPTAPISIPMSSTTD